MSATSITPTRIDPLRLRRVMGRKSWQPPHPFGPAGWRMLSIGGSASVIVSQTPLSPPLSRDDPRSWLGYDATEWIHASMTGEQQLPSYADLMLLKAAVWGDDGEAYQIHPSASRHVNIHEHALHLWGRADGRRVLPDFGQHGTI